MIFYDARNQYAQLPAPAYTYSVQNASDDNETVLLECDELTSTSDNDSDSIEEEHPDDYHKVDEVTMNNIRFSDYIYIFNHVNEDDKKSFIYDERIQYGIDLNKNQIRQTLKDMVMGEKGDK